MTGKSPRQLILPDYSLAEERHRLGLEVAHQADHVLMPMWLKQHGID